MTEGPLIVQSDKTLLLEIDHELSAECRHAIAPFAELERAPEHIHTYRITPLGLWNARAALHDAESVVDTLIKYSRYPVPHALLVDIAETMARYGRLQLHMHPVHGLVLTANDRTVLEEILHSKKIQPLVGKRIDEDTIAVAGGGGNQIKRLSIKGGVFRKMAGGKEVGSIEDRWMNVIFVKMAHSASRQCYAGVYEEGKAVSPICWSNDSIAPDEDVESKEENGRWPFKAYIGMLANNNVSKGRVITKMAFDTKVQFPKVLFSPAGAVEPTDYDTITRQGKSAAAEAAIKLTVFKGKQAEDGADVEPVVREATKRPAAEKSADVSDVVKKWSKK